MSQEQTRTREKILETASRLFSRLGYEKTSLSRVAREAKVSKALIFWHFDTKEKLFRSALRKALEPYFVSVDELEGLDEPAQLCSLMDDFYDFVRDNLYSVRFILSLLLRDQKGPGEVVNRIDDLYAAFRRVMTDVIERGQRKGIFRSQEPAELEASWIMTMLAGLLVHHFVYGSSAEDTGELLRHVKDVALEHLGARA
ncbi:MAG: TetR family transcriptional regulator [Candidatus Binatia bacterium]|nr:MAG: TetR family transcriptional regulator [Candidatus Binatia bacterium]